MIGVFLNYSIGLNSMKFRGSSASIDPGIDKFTMNSLRTRQRQGESTVSTGKNSIFCGYIFAQGVVEAQSSSSRQKVAIDLQQSLKELSTVILRACIIFWFGVSNNYTKSGSMQGGKCSFLTGTKLQKSYLFYICCSLSFFFYNCVGSLPRMLSMSVRESSSVYLSILAVSAKLKYNLLSILVGKYVRNAFLLNILIIINKSLYLIVTYAHSVCIILMKHSKQTLISYSQLFFKCFSFQISCLLSKKSLTQGVSYSQRVIQNRKKHNHLPFMMIHSIQIRTHLSRYAQIFLQRYIVYHKSSAAASCASGSGCSAEVGVSRVGSTVGASTVGLGTALTFAQMWSRTTRPMQMRLMMRTVFGWILNPELSSEKYLRPPLFFVDMQQLQQTRANIYHFKSINPFQRLPSKII